MRISDWSSDVCSSDLCPPISSTRRSDINSRPPGVHASPLNTTLQAATNVAGIMAGSTVSMVRAVPISDPRAFMVRWGVTFPVHRGYPCSRSEGPTPDIQSLTRNCEPVYSLTNKIKYQLNKDTPPVLLLDVGGIDRVLWKHLT